MADSSGSVSRSLVWCHFSKKDDGKGAVCKYCKKYIPIKYGNTSGLIRHLPLHKEAYKEYEDQKKVRDDKKAEEVEEKKRKAGTGSGDSRQMKQPKLNFEKPAVTDPVLQEKFDDALLEYIATSGVSFAQAAGLKDLIAVVNKRIKVPSKWTLARKTDIKAKAVLGEVNKIMAAVRASEELVSIGFTTDLWTSRAGNSFISLTTSFIDHKWRMHRWTPFVKHFPGSHTGVRIALQLDSMIEELHLDTIAIQKYSVNDNAANQKKAIQESAYLTEYNCDIHTMQLGIQDTFKDVVGMKTVLDNSKAIARFTHQTTLAMEQLKKECKLHGVPFRKPKNPQETRWNSSYACMESVWHLRKPLHDLMDKDPKWAQFTLNFREWKLLEGAVKLLKPFLVATKMLEAEKTPTINLVIERIVTLEDGLKRFIADRNNCQFGVTFAKSLLKNLQFRFPASGTERFERRVANYLDPRYKGVHIMNMLGVLEETKAEIVEKYSEENVLSRPSSNESSSLSLSPTSRLLKQARNKRLNENAGSKLESEMLQYESFSLAPRMGNILYWWKSHASILPLLSKIARIVLAIPSSSAKSERVFSTGGIMVTAKRNSLGPDRVECLIVIKENLSKIKEFKIFMSDYEEVEVAWNDPYDKIVTDISHREDSEDEQLDLDCLDDDSGDEEDFDSIDDEYELNDEI